MAITNYGELKASVADWLMRSDLTAVIPDLITLAEARFNRDLRLPDMVKRVNGSFSNQFFKLPTDCMEIIDVSLDDNTKLEQWTSDYMDNVRPIGSNTGKPMAFAVLGRQLEVYPTPPTAGFNCILSYYEALEPMSAATDTNWLLTRHPDLYLYGTLIQSAPYLKEDERLNTWSAMYDRLMDEARRYDERLRFSQARTPRVKARTIG
jgi:hypothetical protein